MGGRLHAGHRRRYTRALIGVVLCAVFIISATVLNIHPGLVEGLFGLGHPLPLYMSVISCLVAAIQSLARHPVAARAGADAGVRRGTASGTDDRDNRG
jgi:hypothetical protein